MLKSLFRVRFGEISFDFVAIKSKSSSPFDHYFSTFQLNERNSQKCLGLIKIGRSEHTEGTEEQCLRDLSEGSVKDGALAKVI